MQTTRATPAERNYERYEKNKRFEEISDIAERIGYAVDTTITYELRGDSLFAMTDTQDRPFHTQTEQAKREGEYKFQGTEAFEYTRLCHEHDEALFIDAFARGEVDADIVMKLSRVPDSVAHGTTAIKGYRRDLLRSFVRIYYKDEEVVKCRLFTLDGNNQSGLERVGDLVGIEVRGKSSEDILASTGLKHVEEAKEHVALLGDYLKTVYDTAVLETTGQVTSAGSRFMDKRDAHSLVASKHNLVEQHMHAIAKIQLLAQADTMEAYLEAERRRVAAAIKLSLEGADISSSDAAAVSAEIATNNYGRECATSTNGMNQTESDLMKDWVKRVEACPLCGEKNVLAQKAGEVISGIDCGCQLNVCTGEKTIGKKKIAQKNAKNTIVNKNARKYHTSEKIPPRKEILTRQFGKYATLRTRTVVGDAIREVVHKYTGDVIARL